MEIAVAVVIVVVIAQRLLIEGAMMWKTIFVNICKRDFFINLRCRESNETAAVGEKQGRN